MVRRKKTVTAEEKTFEELLEELEQAVQILENNEIPLEESIQLFAKSMELDKIAGDKLQLAEQSVEQIIFNEQAEIEYREFAEENLK